MGQASAAWEWASLAGALRGWAGQEAGIGERFEDEIARGVVNRGENDGHSQPREEVNRGPGGREGGKGIRGPSGWTTEKL
jgi:hypothetical protein